MGCFEVGWWRLGQRMYLFVTAVRFSIFGRLLLRSVGDVLALDGWSEHCGSQVDDSFLCAIG